MLMLERFNLALLDGFEPNVGSKRAELRTAMSENLHYSCDFNGFSFPLVVTRMCSRVAYTIRHKVKLHTVTDRATLRAVRIPPTKIYTSYTHTKKGPKTGRFPFIQRLDSPRDLIHTSLKVRLQFKAISELNVRQTSNLKAECAKCDRPPKASHVMLLAPNLFSPCSPFNAKKEV